MPPSGRRSTTSGSRTARIDVASLLILLVCSASVLVYVVTHLGEVRAIVQWISSVGRGG